MIIDIRVQIDTDKGNDSELGEILVDLLTSIKQKLDAEESKSVKETRASTKRQRQSSPKNNSGKVVN